MAPTKTKQAAALSIDHRLQLLVDGVMDLAIYLLEPDGTVSSWNAGAERITGYRSEEIVGKNYSRFFSREDCQAGVPLHLLSEARASGRQETEGWRIRKDGSRFWSFGVIETVHDEAGNFIGFAKIIRDMTEREAARRALAESERQLRLLVRSVVDYALFMLDPNGIVVSWNLGAERIKGYRADEIIGRHFSTFYTPGDRLAGLPRKALEAASATGRFEGEGLRVRKDGTQFWANVVIDAIRDDDGTLVGFAKITRDITERREAEQSLFKAQERVALNQKMEALGQLTGGVAHDFNNLLMIVGGQTEILKRRAASEKDIKALDSIEQAVRHGARLTRQMLAFARENPANRVVVDLSRRVETFRDLLSSVARGDIEFVTSIAEDIWPVHVDPAELELALVNLAVNARDAMASGGIISLKAENRRCEEDDEYRLAGDYVEIRMTDTGSGIAPEHLARVFEPFFTTKPVGKGTGLGLSQVFGFARQSGGNVQISSALDQGTSVSIFLPRTHAQASSAETEGGAEDVVGAATGTVLVVEDNPRVSEVTTALIEQIGYRVIVVHNASDALVALERCTDISLVFSDVVMPGDMDGIALLREVQRRNPHIPVLLTSGYARVADAAEGEFPILRKPYAVSALARAIRTAIGTGR